MYFRNTFTALVGLSSLAAAVPTNPKRSTGLINVTPVEKGLKHKTRAQKRAPLIIQQTVVEPTVILVQDNLDTVAQLALLAEQEFAALVQSQLALVETVNNIQNNIRINHFKSRFSQVNTVIVAVTQVVDVRDSNSQNNRYLVNQLLADNGRPESEVVVMVSAAQPMTIGVATPSSNVADLLKSASAVSQPTGSPQIASYDANAPFGQINSSVLLPFGSQAPTIGQSGAQIFADPASIIFPGQGNLFIEDISAFSQDCAFWGANGNSLFTLAAEVVAAQQIAQIQAAGLVLGSAVNLNNELAAALLAGQNNNNNNNKDNKDNNKDNNNNNNDKKKADDKAAADKAAADKAAADKAAADKAKGQDAAKAQEAAKPADAAKAAEAPKPM